MSVIKRALDKAQANRRLPAKARAAASAAGARAMPAVREEMLPRRKVTLNDRVLVAEALQIPLAEQPEIIKQIRRIKRTILQVAFSEAGPSGERDNFVMIASPLPGAGKTFFSANLALSIGAERDRFVILVDGDTAKRHLTKLAGLENSLGLMDFLENDELALGDVLIDTSWPGVQMIPAGKHREDANELLTSLRMESLLDTLQHSFPGAVVLFDSPPLLLTNEGHVLASVAGQIILMVEEGKTPQAALVTACEGLDKDKPISVVLNRAKAKGEASYWALKDDVYYY